MNMLRHTLIVFAAVMLASCGIYTNYERPAQAVADMDSLYRPEARPDTTRSIATLRWEELFTDTCLQQLIRQGLAANADLAVARLQVEEAQATLRQSKLAYLPSVQLEPTGTLSSFDGQKTQKTYSAAPLLRGKSTSSASCATPSGKPRPRSSPAMLTGRPCRRRSSPPWPTATMPC